jgi:hypothetical protein
MSLPQPTAHQPPDLLQRLFARGLGELLILHVHEGTVMLGQLGLKKNRLTLSDTKYLVDVRPGEVSACFETGVLGMISDASRYQWSSLTFHGLNQCRVKVDLSQTRGSRLQASRDSDGEELMDFIGSVYRGFRLMLDHHFLPVATFRRLQSRTDDWGFAVVDLRMAMIDLGAVRIINDTVRRATERHLEVDLIEEDVQGEKFEELFRSFLPVNPPARVPLVMKTPGAAAAQAVSAPEPPNAVMVAPIPDPGQRAPAPAMSGIPVLEVLQHALGILREVIQEIGAPRAFALFEQWAGRVAEETARQLRKQEPSDLRTARDYFHAMAGFLKRAGETHVVVEENDGILTHEVHDCVYREACRRSGVDPEGRWSTCAQAIPTVRARAAAAMDARLKWTWTRCDRRPGHPCVFELSLGATKQ